MQEVLQRAPIVSGDLAVVVGNTQVLGVLTLSDIAHAVEIGALQADRSSPGPAR